VAICGALGGPTGVTALDAAEAAEVPIAFVAVTVNVYDVLLVSPVTVADVVDPDTVAVRPPGDDVTVYPVIGDPPVAEGAVHDTVAWPFPAVAFTAVGAPGGAAGVTALDAAEAGPGPPAVTAVTVNV